MEPTLTDFEQARLDKGIALHKLSEDHLKPWRDICNDLYRSYRVVSAARDAYRRSPPDRDDIADQMASDWGSDLHIPLAFSTVETILPRAVSNRPRGLVLPDARNAEESVENMRLLVERQQDLMRAELMNQETAKSGFIYGLGAQKGPLWRYEEQKNFRYLDRPAEGVQNGVEWVERTKSRTLFDDAWGEDLDIFDLFWDPFGYDSFTLDWIIHRTWRKSDYCARMLGLNGEPARWDTEAAQALERDDVERMSVGTQFFEDVWKERMDAAGQENFDARGHQLHEVWELHSREGEVVTILDRRIPVRITQNLLWHGQMPFHFYRPTTPGMKQLQGIGEIEPIADLIRELDVLRSQRRDNAAMVLQTPFVFDEDAIDRDDLKIGPGVGIPARTDNPRQHLYRLDMGDIPYSGYKEEESLKEDVDRTSGISDAVTGATGGGAAQTATGVQLVTAAANVRIENKSRRLEVETVTPFTNQMISLNQQMIVTKRDLRVPVEPGPGEIDPKPWAWLEIGPNELKGAMSFAVDAGAMAPKNPAQDAQLGMNLWNALRDNPTVEQSMLVKHFLESQGIKQAGTWLRPPDPQVPVAKVQQLVEALGKTFDPEKVSKVAEYVMAEDEQ